MNASVRAEMRIFAFLFLIFDVETYQESGVYAVRMR